jgi:phosphoribosyl 1,2-cyclic phosphate phosphodiesterase
MSHGPYCDVLGFRIGNVAYCTDTNNISDSSLDLLRDLDCLVLDALRFSPHPTHFNVEQALEVISELKPGRAYLTHLSHDLDYEEVNANLPDNIELAYDGLRIPLS